MRHWLISGALLSLPARQGGPPPSVTPRVVEWTAVRAIEGDSTARVRSRWTALLARNSGDRAARFGLATLARLTYDYPAAERGYGELIARPLDAWTPYAHLGLAQGYEVRSISRDARKALDNALVAARAVGDRTAECEVLMWLVFSRGRLEGNSVAEAILDSAERLVPDSALGLQARLKNRRAITEVLHGRPAEASAVTRSAVDLARRAGDRRAEADAWRIAGQVLQYRGQWDSALTALRRAETLYVAARNRSALASSFIWQAQALAGLGRYGEYRVVMQRALEEGKATNNPDAVGDAHRAFGVLAAMFGDWPGAAVRLRQSKAISIASGDSSSAQTTSKYLARVALVAGDIETARRLTRDLLAWAERTKDAGVLYETHRLMANIVARDGDTAAVVRELAAARAQLTALPGANYRVWLLHDEARHAFARGNLELAAKLFEQYVAGSAGPIGRVSRFDGRVRLAAVHAAQGDIVRAESELASPTDEIDSWRYGLNDAQLRTVAFQAVATIDAATSDPDGIAAAAASVQAALVRGGKAESAFALAERWRARVLMEHLARSAGLRDSAPTRMTGSLSSAAPRTAADVRATLDDSTALLEFVAARGAPVTAFVVQRRGVTAAVLGSADSIGDAAVRLRSLLESGGDPSALSRSLGAALLDAPLALVDRQVTRLIIVPDGPLHRVAFDALRLRDGRFLVQRYATGLAPSASAATALRSMPASPGEVTRLLAMGNPTRGTSGSANGERSESAVPDLPPLQGAAKEARRVAQYASQGEVRLGRDASASFLTTADLEPYRVLHFATHAIVDERTITGTALVLAPGGTSNGLVGTGDLAALRLRADLVVLSACTSAGGTLATGEGVQGLTSSFLQAGARVVVATGWRIRDKDVVPLVDDFYAGLARGVSVMDALRAAKLRALESGAPPRTWAAFVAVGDPRATVPVHPAPRVW